MDNKTIINAPTPNPNGKPATSDSFYSQSSGANSAKINRTYIQGMKPRSENADARVANTDDTQQSRVTDIELQERPLAGILYSVSNDECGELFPVYVGRNVIGSSSDSDIYLTEETVSDKHAMILVRIINSEKRGKIVTMSISDNGSDFGTVVNGVTVLDDIVLLKGMESIQIGNAYKFIFIPLSADMYGLSTDTSFRPTKRIQNKPLVHSDYRNFIISAQEVDEEIYPDAVGEEHENTFYGRTKEKKEDHSGKKTL